MLTRRSLLAGVGACTPVLAAPAMAPAMAAPSAARTLRFVPQGNLNHPDPLVTLAPVARNSGHMIWDQLYGLTLSGAVRPQMVAGHERSADGRSWTFTLREGLAFHDGAPVRAADCVASLRRWGQRRSIGQKILAEAERIAALDDRRFVIATRQPMANLPVLLGRDTFFFVMPEDVARTPPLQQITRFVGSGPFRFVPDEWQPGARAVFARNAAYVPRPEPADFLAGGKQAWFERVEWHILPDPATAAAALQRGEVDWVQRPLPDLLAALRGAPGVVVGAPDPAGAVMMLLMNQTQPPFDNAALRRALLPALDQARFMQAVSDDRALARPGVGFFTPDQGMDSAAGMEALLAPRDVARARRLVRESGYAGQKVVMLQPSDIPEQRAVLAVAHEMLRDLGVNAELATMDQGTLEKRRLNREAVEKGGWSMCAVTFDGLGAADPANHQPLRGNGAAGFFGWPTNPAMEALRERWFLATDTAAQRSIAAEMQRLAFAEVPFLPLGQVRVPMAMRDGLTGVTATPFPVFWGVRRGA